MISERFQLSTQLRRAGRERIGTAGGHGGATASERRRPGERSHRHPRTPPAASWPTTTPPSRSPSSADQQASARLDGTALDCGGLALGLYTGALTSPQPAALGSLTTAQTAAIDSTEVNVVAQVVVEQPQRRRPGGSSRRPPPSASRPRPSPPTGATYPLIKLGRPRPRAAFPRRPPPWPAPRRSSAASDRSLAAGGRPSRRSLWLEWGTPVPDPPSSPGLSIMGASALNGPELTAWFAAQGYTDLTSTSIAQLANWYVTDGVKEEGARRRGLRSGRPGNGRVQLPGLGRSRRIPRVSGTVTAAPRAGRSPHRRPAYWATCSSCGSSPAAAPRRGPGRSCRRSRRPARGARAAVRPGNH